MFAYLPVVFLKSPSPLTLPLFLWVDVIQQSFVQCPFFFPIVTVLGSWMCRLLAVSVATSVASGGLPTISGSMSDFPTIATCAADICLCLPFLSFAFAETGCDHGVLCAVIFGLNIGFDGCHTSFSTQHDVCPQCCANRQLCFHSSGCGVQSLREASAFDDAILMPLCSVNFVPVWSRRSQYRAPRARDVVSFRQHHILDSIFHGASTSCVMCGSNTGVLSWSGVSQVRCWIFSKSVRCEADWRRISRYTKCTSFPWPWQALRMFLTVACA